MTVKNLLFLKKSRKICFKGVPKRWFFQFLTRRTHAIKNPIKPHGKKHEFYQVVPYSRFSKIYVVKIPWNHFFVRFYSRRASIWDRLLLKSLRYCIRDISIVHYSLVPFTRRTHASFEPPTLKNTLAYFSI